MAKNKIKDIAEPTIIDESTLAGALIAKELRVLPFPDENRRVRFAVYGDVAKALREIYENQKIGSLDMINGIKSARSMIWNLKEKK